MPSDKTYKITKRIMLGESVMNPDFRLLADFIDQTFGVKTINIIYDTFGVDKRPRLNICFEFGREQQVFNENNAAFNFDSKKQQLIARKFKETLKEQDLGGKNGIWSIFTNSDNDKYNTRNVFVCYSAFEPIARIEAYEKIQEQDVARLKKELRNQDLWTISRAFGEPTFFLYTDEQVQHYENSDMKKEWANKYFDLLVPNDEFRYFTREKFNICLDSRENFDTNYSSNWFYYYR